MTDPFYQGLVIGASFVAVIMFALDTITTKIK